MMAVRQAKYFLLLMAHSGDVDYDDDDEIQIDIFFSVSKLPDELAQPRVDDDRIGFFAIAYWDLGLHAPAGTASSRDADKRVKLINRWPLEKDTSVCWQGIGVDQCKKEGEAHRE